MTAIVDLDEKCSQEKSPNQLFASSNFKVIAIFLFVHFSFVLSFLLLHFPLGRWILRALIVLFFLEWPPHFIDFGQRLCVTVSHIPWRSSFLIEVLKK